MPGHPFRIQNKAENYNSLLSKTATRKLDAALADMIGGYGEKVPGLAVIVYKNGKEVYRNMMGNRFLSPRNKNWNLPVTSDSRLTRTGTCPLRQTAVSVWLPFPKFSPQPVTCSWWKKAKSIWTKT